MQANTPVFNAIGSKLMQIKNNMQSAKRCYQVQAGEMRHAISRVFVGLSLLVNTGINTRGEFLFCQIVQQFCIKIEGSPQSSNGLEPWDVEPGHDLSGSPGWWRVGSKPVSKSRTFVGFYSKGFSQVKPSLFKGCDKK